MHAGGGDAHDQQQAQGVDQNVALAPVDLLARVVASLTGDRRGLDALAVQTAGGGVLVTAAALTRPGAERVMEASPGPIAPPAAEVIVHSRPGWEVAGQLTPLTTGLEHVEDGIDDLAQAQLRGAPHPGARQQRLDRLPSAVAEVAGVTFSAVLPRVFFGMCTIYEKNSQVKLLHN